MEVWEACNKASHDQADILPTSHYRLVAKVEVWDAVLWTASTKRLRRTQ